MTFKEAAEFWLKVYKISTIKDSTYNESYLGTVDRYLNPILGGKDIDKITPLDIKELYNHYSIIYSQSTMNKMRICLKGIFEVSIANGYCIRNPIVGIKVVSKIESNIKHTYSAPEVKNIYKEADNHKYGIYIRILLELGLRCSELCGLRWSDFDFDNKTVHIQRACTELKGQPYIGKTKNRSSNRVLPVSTELINQLKKAKPEEDNYLLVSRKGGGYEPLRPCAFYESRYKTFFADIGSIATDNFLTPHELRHTCGTLLYEKTGDIYAVSKFLGHANVTITIKIYVHDNPEMLRKALEIN